MDVNLNLEFWNAEPPRANGHREISDRFPGKSARAVVPRATYDSVYCSVIVTCNRINCRSERIVAADSRRQVSCLFSVHF